MNVKCESSKMKTVLAVLLSVIVAFAMIGIGTGNANAATKAPKKIYLAKQASYVDYGAKVKVYVKKVKPSKAKKNVKWAFTKSKYKKYASLKSKKSTSVYVYGKKAGTVKVKAASKYRSSVSKTVSIKVKNLKAKAVSVTGANNNLQVGKTVSLTAAVTAPQKYGYKKQTTVWKSSDTSVATVNAAGVVTAVKKGNVTITATNDGASGTTAIHVVGAASSTDAAGTTTGAPVKKYDLGAMTAATTTFKYNGTVQTVDFTPADLMSLFNSEGSTKVQFWNSGATAGTNGIKNTFEASAFSFKSVDSKYALTKSGNEIKVVENGAITYWYFNPAKSIVTSNNDKDYTLTLYSKDGTQTKQALSFTAKTNTSLDTLTFSFNGVKYNATRDQAKNAVTLYADGSARFTIINPSKTVAGPYTIEADSNWAKDSGLMV